MTELRILFRVLFKCLWLGSDLFQIFMIKLKFFSAMTEFRLLYKNLLPNSDFFQTLVLATERKPLFKYLSSSYDFFFQLCMTEFRFVSRNLWQYSDFFIHLFKHLWIFVQKPMTLLFRDLWSISDTYVPAQTFAQTRFLRAEMIISVWAKFWAGT